MVQPVCVGSGEGFSPNLLWLLHAFPLFGPPTNGTFYLDSTQFPHKCNETGGWTDFFAGTHMLPWTPEAQAAEKDACVRLRAKEIDDMLHKLHTGTEELDGMAVNRVGLPSSMAAASSPRSAALAACHAGRPLPCRLPF
jgi:hypothetical protein